MGINGSELVVLIIVALVVIGPERLPQAAEQLARLVRELKRLAQGAKETVREELGPEVADIDLSKLDIRQYDPRRIVREALLEDLTTPSSRPPRPAARPAAPPEAPSRRAALTSPAAVVAAATRSAATGPAGASPPGAVPFDDEAT